jgi:hypothetical protein
LLLLRLVRQCGFEVVEEPGAGFGFSPGVAVGVGGSGESAAAGEVAGIDQSAGGVGVLRCEGGSALGRFEIGGFTALVGWGGGLRSGGRGDCVFNRAPGAGQVPGAVLGSYRDYGFRHL